MGPDDTIPPPPHADSDPNFRDAFLALAIAWSAAEPHRVGEVALFEKNVTSTLGCGDGAESRRVRFQRLRPGAPVLTLPLASSVPEEKIRVVSRGDRLHVERIGLAELRVNGHVVNAATLVCGDTVDIGGELLLVCTRRTRSILVTPFPEAFAIGAFGEPDEYGIVGESVAAWDLRLNISLAADSGTVPRNVFIFGAPGTGKGLAARAVHLASRRAASPFVFCRASTLSEKDLVMQVFGNVAHFPYAHLDEQPGFVGQAEGGTLLLDEVLEGPRMLQAVLMRVLDPPHPFARAGEESSKERRADTLFIATTRGPRVMLQSPFLARFTQRIEMPTLADRPEDTVLLARHIVLETASRVESARRFVRKVNGRDEVAMSLALAEALVHWSYEANVSELRALLEHAMRSSSDVLEVPDAMVTNRRPRARPTPPPRPAGSGSLRLLN